MSKYKKEDREKKYDSVSDFIYDEDQEAFQHQERGGVKK